MEHVDWQINKSTLESTKYILEHEVNCDIRFKVGEDQEVIKAHKFILSIRSPVFDRMFNGSFCESETDPVIPDVSPAAFETLLRYCYYDCLDIKGDVALSVLYAATKYMLPILERAARKTLIKKPDSSNIWDVCKYSTDVGDEELHAGCITYFKQNLSETNILDVIRYAVTTGHEELRACCKTNLPRYLSGSKIWEVYKYAFNEGNTEAHQHCKEYFQKDIATVSGALQSEEFCSIPNAVLSDILHINDKVDKAVFENGISISDIELFRACNKWAGAECLRQKIDSTGVNKRTVLGECLFLIRFPTMLQKDLANIVYPSGILTPIEIVNLGQYIHRDPGAECQVDFPCKERQFVVSTSGTTYIESEVRVMLSRLWTWWSDSFKVTVRDERSQRLWSMVLDTKHENHLDGDTDKILSYLDIEPPQVLEAGTRYSVTAEGTQGGTLMYKQPGVEYIKILRKCSPYKEVKIPPGMIDLLTLSLV